MKVKDLFGILLNSEDVSLYKTGDLFLWEGEFKEIPSLYFESIIDEIYSVPSVDKGAFIVIVIK